MQDIYSNRDRVWHLVDTIHQHHMSTSSELCGVAFTGCLDAPDVIPAGACKAFTIPVTPTKSIHLADACTVVRGRTMAEQQAIDDLAEQLISEILAEEAHNLEIQP